MRRLWPFAKAAAGAVPNVAPPSQRRALRLLSIPGRHHENKYFAQLLGQMERRGVRVIPPALGPLASFGFDVLHLNFPTHQITENRAAKAWLLSILLGGYLLAAKASGRSIIYTVHDVTPLRVRHPWLLRHFASFVHRLVSGYVFLSHSSQASFVERHPSEAGKPAVLAPHGPYAAELLTAEERAERRHRLAGGRDVFLVGFLGAIKPYKNIDALRHLPQRLADGRPVHVVVAGRVEAGYAEAAATSLACLPHEQLTRLEHRLSDGELNGLIQTVDVVLLPYTRGSNSGAALLVLSNHGRLVGSELRIFRELANQIGSPWVYALAPGSGGRSYADLIEQAAAERPSALDRQDLASFLHAIDWPVAAEAVHRLCQSVRSGSMWSGMVDCPDHRPVHPGDGFNRQPCCEAHETQ